MNVSTGIINEKEMGTRFDMRDEIVQRAYKRLLFTIERMSSLGLDGNHGESCSKLLLPALSLRASAYAAPLLAEPFGFTDWHLVQEVTFGSLCLDSFTHLVDDATDIPEGHSVLLHHVGSLLLAKGAQVYGELITRGDGFWKYWEDYFREASEAERFLWGRRGRIVPFGPTDFVMLGQKSALIKLSAAFYASVTGKWGILAPIQMALRDVSTGVQLIDDLFDWKEDERASAYTYPLALARKQCRAGQSVAEAINSDAVVPEVLRSAEFYLQRGRRCLQNVGAVEMGRYINMLIHEIREARVYVQDKPKPIDNDFGDFIHRRLRRMISPRLGH